MVHIQFVLILRNDSEQCSIQPSFNFRFIVTDRQLIYHLSSGTLIFINQYLLVLNNRNPHYYYILISCNSPLALPRLRPIIINLLLYHSFVAYLTQAVFYVQLWHDPRQSVFLLIEFCSSCSILIYIVNQFHDNFYKINIVV